MRCHELSTQKVKICVFKLSYLVPLLYLSDTINYQNNPENEDMFISVVTSGTISLLDYPYLVYYFTYLIL